MQSRETSERYSTIALSVSRNPGVEIVGMDIWRRDMKRRSGIFISYSHKDKAWLVQLRNDNGLWRHDSSEHLKGPIVSGAIARAIKGG